MPGIGFIYSEVVEKRFAGYGIVVRRFVIGC